METFENLLEHFRMLKNFIDVNQDIVDVSKHSFNEALGTGWASEKTHWRSDPVKLTFSWNGESSQVLRISFEFHLPKTRSQIQCREHI